MGENRRQNRRESPIGTTIVIVPNNFKDEERTGCGSLEQFGREEEERQRLQAFQRRGTKQDRAGAPDYRGDEKSIGSTGENCRG